MLVAPPAFTTMTDTQALKLRALVLACRQIRDQNGIAWRYLRRVLREIAQRKQHDRERKRLKKQKGA